MEKVLKKQVDSLQHTLFGLTPLYYYLLSPVQKINFNTIASKADKPSGFIEATIEVASFYEDFYILNKRDSLTEEQITFLESEEVSSLFMNLMQNYKQPIDDLRNIRKQFYHSTEIYEDMLVGEISFKDLMGISNGKNLLNHLNAQIKRCNPLTKDEITDLSPSAIARKMEVTVNLEKLLEAVNFAIEKINGQISVLEGIGDTDITTKELQEEFAKICDSVEVLDNVLMGRRADGTVSENTRQLSQKLLYNCNTIGFNVMQNISGNMYAEKGNVQYNKKIYNRQRINGLNDKKDLFSTARASIVTAIHNIKKGEERSIFYF